MRPMLMVCRSLVHRVTPTPRTSPGRRTAAARPVFASAMLGTRDEPGPADTGGHAMGFAAGVFLLTAGAILAFALRVDLWWINVHTAGLVLMLAGIVVLAVAALPRRERRRAPYGEPPGPPSPSVPAPPAPSPVGIRPRSNIRPLPHGDVEAGRRGLASSA